MLSSWLFIEFALTVADEDKISLNHLAGPEKTVYYADEGKTAYRLVIAQPKDFDPDEVIQILKIAMDAKRRLIMLFHRRHYDSVIKAIHAVTDMVLSSASENQLPDDKLLAKLGNEIKGSASLELKQEQIKLGKIYGLSKKDESNSQSLQDEILNAYQAEDWGSVIQNVRQTRQFRQLSAKVHAAYLIAQLKLKCDRDTLERLDPISLERIEEDGLDDWKITFYLELIECLVRTNRTTFKNQIQYYAQKCTMLTADNSQLDRLKAVKKRIGLPE